MASLASGYEKIDPKVSSEPVWITFDRKGQMVNLGGKINESNYLETYAKDFGHFEIFQDTLSPIIELLNSFSPSDRKLKFLVKDNLKESGRATRLSYEALCNGSWIPVDYDLKSNTMECTVPESVEVPFNFELIISDYSKNTSRRTIRIK